MTKRAKKSEKLALTTLSRMATEKHLTFLDFELEMIDEQVRLEPGYFRNQIMQTACQISFERLKEVSSTNPEAFDFMLSGINDFKTNLYELLAVTEKCLERVHAADCREAKKE